MGDLPWLRVRNESVVEFGENSGHRADGKVCQEVDAVTHQRIAVTLTLLGQVVLEHDDLN